MGLIVQKYGGTSVGNSQRILEVAKNIHATFLKGHSLVVVVSAMMGETNRLLNLAKKIAFNQDKSQLDILAATGEQVSIALISMALKELDLKVKTYCGWQIPIITSDDYNNARIKTINSEKLLEDIKSGYIIIVAGFQGITNNQNITTLGRGGADTSAVALAVTLKADECQIFTDVDGVYNMDPNKLPGARKIEQVNGACMLEATSLGTKVLQVRSCELAYRYKTNIRVLSTFEKENRGTLVMNQPELENYSIISLATEDQQVFLNFTILDSINPVLIDLYSKTSLDMLNIHQNNLSFVVNASHINEVTSIINNYKIENLKIIESLVKISLIGSGFRSNRELNQKIWQFINEIEVLALSHNEISLSFLLASEQVTPFIQACKGLFLIQENERNQTTN